MSDTVTVVEIPVAVVEIDAGGTVVTVTENVIETQVVETVERGLPGAKGDKGDPGLVDLTEAEIQAIVDEVIAARGDRSALGSRIETLGNFASPNAGGIIVGQYYDNAFHGTASPTLAPGANQITLVPFITSRRFRIDQIGVAVTVPSSGALGKCVIYGSDANGWPDELLYEGGSDLDLSGSGYKSHSLDLTFDAGRQYWLGLRTNQSGPGVRSINVGAAVNLGVNGSEGANYFTVLRRTVTYANAAPDPWAFVAGDRVAAVTPPSIRMRAAALA